MELFPHKKIREGQKEFMEDVEQCVNKREHLIANAPTGIGKTAGVLTKALEYILENNKKVFFLTPRHSQHKIVINTVKKMNNKKKIKTADIIGKQHMCPKDTSGMSSQNFTDLCKKLREDNSCSNYKKTKKGKKFSSLAQKKIEKLKKEPVHAEELKKECQELCPYEISMALIKKADLIVCDYYHLFSTPRETILSRANIDLNNIIIIVDEAHNFPSRIRKLLSRKLSSFTLKNGIREAEQFEYPLIKDDLKSMQNILKELWNEEDRFVHKHEFMNKVSDYESLLADLEEASSIVLEEAKRSYFSIISKFMEAWLGSDKGFARIIKKDKTRKQKEYYSLCYNSLDASPITSPIFNDCHSAILMSGTLKPMEMYQDLLGMSRERTKYGEYPSPFPSKNRLDLLIPDVTTKYKERNKEQYRKIAHRITQCIDNIPGNVACFFPSYALRDTIINQIQTSKTIFREESFMNKEEKNEILEDFVTNGNGLLTGAQAGSLAEGIDYPGVYLNGVIIVGIALKKPTIEVKSLINYYQKKFGKGWEYAYSFPAVQRAIQTSGRPIRSEKDVGVVVFMDKRFAWNNYRKIFPNTLQIKPTTHPEKDIKSFLSKHNITENK